MRLIRTFIVRLYADPDHRERTCGDVTALPGRTPHPFKTGDDLIVLLQRLAHEGANASLARTAPGADDPDLSDLTRAAE